MAQTAVAEETIEIPGKLVGTQWPGVGVAVWIVKDDAVLVGKRGGASHFARETWCCPGGKLDHGESWEDCARRETLEEAGIEIANLRFFGLTNDLYPDEGRHWITIDMAADWVSGKPEVLEPGKMEAWEWVSWEELTKRPLMRRMENTVAQGFSPFQRTLQVGVKALIKNDRGEYLLFQRREPRPAEQRTIWEIPGGRIKLGEETQAALAREIAEETGLALQKVERCVGVQSILRNPKLHVVRNTFEVEVSGELKAFVANDEHDKAEWFSLVQIKSLAPDPYLAEVLFSGSK